MGEGSIDDGKKHKNVFLVVGLLTHMSGVRHSWRRTVGQRRCWVEFWNRGWHPPQSDLLPAIQKEKPKSPGVKRNPS